MSVILVIVIWLVFLAFYTTETNKIYKFIMFFGFLWILGQLIDVLPDSPTTLIQIIGAVQVFGVLASLWGDTFSIDYENGTVTIHETGLMWQMFAIGQSWDKNAVIGTASMITYEEAKKITSNLAGKNDWRLPTFEELNSIVKDINNTTKFPNAPLEFFWSSSLWDDNKVRGIQFKSGAEFDHFMGRPGCVRLVRTVTHEEKKQKIPKN